VPYEVWEKPQPRTKAELWAAVRPLMFGPGRGAMPVREEARIFNELNPE